MPTPGKSLVGFMDQPAAVAYLRSNCVPAPGATDHALIAEWQAAAARLGAAYSNAGIPDIQQIPASHAQRVKSMLAQPWLQPWSQMLAQCNIELVEIRPLLAFQFHVDAARSNHHCAPFSAPPTLDELIDACLPLTPPAEPYQILPGGPNSLLITSRSLNWKMQGQGLLANNVAGVYFNITLPHVHVVRYNGRYFLHNGFHRTFGAGMAGATHVPCLVRDVATPEEAGINAGTFSEALLFSGNAPTLAHYIDGRSHDVNLRIFTRSVHVSWSEYTVPFE